MKIGGLKMLLRGRRDRDFRATPWAVVCGWLRVTVPEMLAGIGMVIMLVLIVMAGGMVG